MKTIFREVPQLESVPRALWPRVCQMLVLHTVAKGEKLLARAESQVPGCVVLTGAFDVSYGDGAKDSNRLLPGSICGDFQFLNGRHWRPADVVAARDSSAATFSASELSQLIAAENSNQSYKSLIAFLVSAVPRFDQLSGSLRDRLGRLFLERTFFPGSTIVKEGSKMRTVYLIKEGRCNIVAAENSSTKQGEVEDQFDLASERSQPLGHKRLTKGYMSSSTSRLQLRTIGEREWFGEEVLLLGEGEEDAQAFGYTVSTAVKTVVLTITRENLNKFPRDVLEQLRHNAREKAAWQRTRKVELARSLVKITRLSTMIDYVGPDPLHAQNTKLTSEEKSNLMPLADPDSNNSSELSQGMIAPGSHSRGKTADSRVFRKAACTEPLGQTMSLAQLRRNQSRTFAERSWRGGMFATFYRRPERDPVERRFLATASTLKEAKGCGTVRPIMVRRSRSVRRFVSLRRRPESYEGLEETANECAKNTFRVGVRDVRAMDLGRGKRPPSPNPVKIWAERNGIDIMARNRLVKPKYAVPTDALMII